MLRSRVVAIYVAPTTWNGRVVVSASSDIGGFFFSLIKGCTQRYKKTMDSIEQFTFLR